MYESTFENVKSSFQPLIELAELNRKTLERMTSVQTSYLTDCISSSIKQVKTLAASGSPQRAAELSFEMIKEFESKLTGATEQNLAALAELQAAYSSLVNGSCTGSYARIVELCSLKDAFTSSGLKVSSVTAKQATVKKTPAKAPEAAAKVEAKPVVAEKPAAPAVEVKVAPVAETKAAPVVKAKPAVAETKAAPVVKAKPVVAETKAAPVVKAKPAVAETKAAPVVKAKPAVAKSAPVAAAEKAPVKRAAAKPTVKKSSAKPAKH